MLGTVRSKNGTPLPKKALVKGPFCAALPCWGVPDTCQVDTSLRTLARRTSYGLCGAAVQVSARCIRHASVQADSQVLLVACVPDVSRMHLACSHALLT